MEQADVVIVGAGHGGAQCAIALRQGGFTGSVVMIGREPEPPYERPPLSKEYFAREKTFDRLYIRPPEFWGEKGIELILGTEVTGVTSTRNLELVRSIGADHVVDYTKTDFSQTGQQYDLILDTIGNISISAARRALSPAGRCVVAGFTTLRHLAALGLLGNLKSEKAEKKVGMMGTAEVKKPE